MVRFFLLCCLFLSLSSRVDADGESIYLRDNLGNAQTGDFIVTLQNKTYTLLHIYERSHDYLTVEEIAIPTSRINVNAMNWKDWVYRGAQGSTSWILYRLNLRTAHPNKYYSVIRGTWFEMPERENFLATLLNLKLERLSDRERKKVGVAIIPSADSRQVWNPKLVFNGEVVPGARFDAWRTKWPEDGSEAAGKMIEAYTPQDSRYASYFPYWLQISGIVGAAKFRIIDAGDGLQSPAPNVYNSFK